ncbi:MAG: PD40 domain-containing protein [Marinospirillum sp.]|uniref:TolB family protein n=1 Tax=Marinospirillum sp. TaxID=2183934 RepID=UPI001A100A9A|nr:hypothetical protein [Marinospirillum sp.]MBE0507349.1 PD40 domain-containing protein [Marinospirillum sp.]
MPRIKITLGLLLGASLLPGSPLQANPTDWRNNRVLPLERVTVGPSDNYQARMNTATRQLVYTRSQNLISAIWLQQLDIGTGRPLLPADHDSKDPAISPDGQQLAMTLFRFDAPGDICIQPLPEGTLSCLQQPGSREWSPFWINNQQLGYLQTHPLTRQTELKIHHISSKQDTSLLQGNISAPAASSDGQWLVYHRRDTAATTGLYLYNLHQQQELGPLQFDLPGISSHARIDSQTGMLYFSHYMNDTSADQQIDAEDHSVIFRLPLQQALDLNKTSLPEQLTSLEHNCNFPELTSEHLYVTCAYEGSLDTYRLPLSGQIPSHWQAAELSQAQQHASSYQQRLLLLNALRLRTEDNGITILERQLSNHLSLKEFTAAQYYVNHLQQAYRNNQPELTDFYLNLDQLLQLLSLHQQQPPGILTVDFRQTLETKQQQLQPSPNQGSAPLFAAWFQYLLGNHQQARQLLPHLQTAQHPLQAALLLDLSLQLHKDQPQALRQLLLQASQSEQLNADGRLFYAFNWLKHLTSALTPAEQEPIIQAALQNTTDPRVNRLFRNELDLLALAKTRDVAEERQIYQRLSQALKVSPEDILWRRFAHIRAIQVMGLAEKYDFMELMSRHWLTATRLTEPGFAATAEQYGAINLARGYGSLQQAQYNTALNTFYTVTRQTSDPEALYQLLLIGLQLDSSLTERMQRLLEQLEAEQLLGANRHYVAALRTILEHPQPDDKQLQQAAEQLQQHQAPGINRGAADLLTGSIHHRRLRLSSKGYSHDQQLYQLAHYHYMRGLDLAYSNPRTQAALLENLGQLHFTVRNYGLAADFFAQRLQFPFLQPEDEIWLRWRYARALYYSNRMATAADQAMLAQQLGERLKTPQQPALLERSAFYALQAGRYEQSIQAYQQLLQQQTLEPVNQTRARFSLAYALLKQGQQQAAKQLYQQVLQDLPDLGAGSTTADRLLAFQPRRLELQSYGFLAQLAEQPEERLKWQQQRLALLQQMKSDDLRYGFDEQGRLSQLIQTRLQLAVTQEELQQQPDMVINLQQTLNVLLEWQNNGSSLASQPVLQSLYNYLQLAADYPQAFSEEPKTLKPLLQAVQSELTVEPFTPPTNQAQQLKLQLLLEHYHFRRGEQDITELKQKLQTLQSDERWTGLVDSRPDLYLELEELAAGILSRSVN